MNDSLCTFSWESRKHWELLCFYCVQCTQYKPYEDRLEMKVLESFVLFQCILMSRTEGDGKKKVYAESEGLTLGSGKHKAGSGKRNEASGKRKGTDGFRYHEVKHRKCQQWERRVGNGQLKCTGEEWTGGTVSPLNGDLSSCRCSRGNDSLPCYDVAPASCKINAGTSIRNSVTRVICDELQRVRK